MYKFAVLALAGVAAATASVKRQATENFQLYAYGKGIGGWSVRYADGMSNLILWSSLLTRTGSAFITKDDVDVAGYSPMNCMSLSSSNWAKLIESSYHRQHHLVSKKQLNCHCLAKRQVSRNKALGHGPDIERCCVRYRHHGSSW
jgi:hypothetical protein